MCKVYIVYQNIMRVIDWLDAFYVVILLCCCKEVLLHNVGMKRAVCVYISSCLLLV